MMRSVPHTLSLATSLRPPSGCDIKTVIDSGDLGDFIGFDCSDGTTTVAFQSRTGWSGDGAPASPNLNAFGQLRDFITGAVIQHYTRNFFVRSPFDPSFDTCGLTGDQPCFRLPTDDELDQVVLFMSTAGRTADIDLSSIVLTESSADAGRKIFQGSGVAEGLPNGKCFGCHNNAGANSAFGGNRSFNTGIERVRLEQLGDGNTFPDANGVPDCDVSSVTGKCIPFDGAFGGQGLGDFSFNFDTDGDGRLDAFGNGKFNVPPLIESSDTAPFFHTNAFSTIERAVEFYSSDTFNSSPSSDIVRGALGTEPDGRAIALTGEQTESVAAFLRVINAAFNLAIAEQRTTAAKMIVENFGPADDVAEGLIQLAIDELEDAESVLIQERLNGSLTVLNIPERDKVIAAIRNLEKAIIDPDQSLKKLNRALRKIQTAQNGLGAGISFELGEGNLMGVARDLESSAILRPTPTP